MILIGQNGAMKKKNCTTWEKKGIMEEEEEEVGSGKREKSCTLLLNVTIRRS